MKPTGPPNIIILPDQRQARKLSEVSRGWISERFQLTDEKEDPIPAMRIPFSCVNIPISQAILEITDIECAQVRGLQSSVDFEATFLAAGAWDSQFLGALTVAVTPPVIELYRKHFKGKNADDPKASAKFRQALGVAVMANPAAFSYDCTDGAHRTKLGKEHFAADVRPYIVLHNSL